jgi:hypothetical protein
VLEPNRYSSCIHGSLKFAGSTVRDWCSWKMISTCRTDSNLTLSGEVKVCSRVDGS